MPTTKILHYDKTSVFAFILILFQSQRLEKRKSLQKMKNAMSYPTLSLSLEKKPWRIYFSTVCCKNAGTFLEESHHYLSSDPEQRISQTTILS